MKRVFIILITIAVLLFTSGCNEGLMLSGIILANAMVEDIDKKAKKTSSSQSYKPRQNTYTNRSTSLYQHQNTKKPPDEKELKKQQLNKTYQQGWDAYMELDWTRAYRLLENVIEDEYSDDDIKQNSCIILGGIEYQHGNIEKAYQYFKSAKTIDPRAVPSEDIFPPEMINYYRDIN